AEGLDRLVEMDLAAVDAELHRSELLGDVDRGDGAEELLLLTHLAADGHLGLGDALGELGGARLALGLGGQRNALLVLDLADVARGRQHGLVVRDEEVAAVTATDLDDVARITEVGDVLT